MTAPRPPPARTGGGVRRSPSMRPRRWTRTTGRAEVARSVRGCVLRAVWGRKEQLPLPGSQARLLFSEPLSLAVTTRPLSCQLLFPPCTAKITEGGTLGRGKSESSHVHTLLVITQQSRKARKQTAIREPHGCEDARGNIYSWPLIRAIRHEACPTPSPPACRPSRTPHAHAQAAATLAHRLTPSFEFEIRTPQPSDPAIKFSPFRRKRRGTEREGDPVCNRRPAVLRLRVPTAAAGPG